jgi:hypothetical protein
VSGGFKRSSRFGIVGLFVAAGLCVVIALTTGQGEANPKLTLGLIFAVLAVYFVILFALQRSDLERSAGGDVRATERAVAEGGRAIENPMTISEPELWAAMAVHPIDADAVRARREMWGAGRGSLRLGVWIVLVIFVAVPSTYMFETFVPVLVGAGVIALLAVYGSVRALAPGGQLDSGYEQVGRAMAPLGLAVTERPKVSVEMREPVTPRVGPRISGALVLSGERHGRAVTARLGEGERGRASEVTVRAAVPEFEARSRDGRVRAAKGAPEAIAAALAAVPNSIRWKKVRVEGGPEGIVVTRKAGGQGDWLADLWLAEHLAAALP